MSKDVAIRKHVAIGKHVAIRKHDTSSKDVAIGKHSTLDTTRTTVPIVSMIRVVPVVSDVLIVSVVVMSRVGLIRGIMPRVGVMTTSAGCALHVKI